MMPRSSFLLAALVLLFAVVSAAPAALKVGDAAPKPAVGSWAQGNPVKAFEGDKVYIIEFWATWCGPCVQVIPHLNELAKRHEKDGLVVIGQNLGEDEAKVKAFIQKMGSKMGYRVAVDDAAGTMSKTWLKAAGQNGIPCAFVVDKKGRIAYIGHPMSHDEALLKKLLAEPSTKAPDTAARPQAKTPSAKAMELAGQAKALLAAGKADEAEAVIARVHPELETPFAYLGGLLELELLLLRKNNDDAMALAETLAEDYPESGVAGTLAAELLARSPEAPAKMLVLADKLAAPAAGSDGPARCAALSVLARVAFRQGDAAKAVERQKQAVDVATPAEASTAKSELEAYQNNRLP